MDCNRNLLEAVPSCLSSICLTPSEWVTSLSHYPLPPYKKIADICLHTWRLKSDTGRARLTNLAKENKYAMTQPGLKPKPISSLACHPSLIISDHYFTCMHIPLTVY